MTQLEITQIKDLQEEVAGLSDKLHVMGQNVDKILNALVGDDLGKDPGMITDYKTIRKDVDELKEFKKRLVWTCLGVSAGVVFVLRIVFELLNIG